MMSIPQSYGKFKALVIALSFAGLAGCGSGGSDHSATPAPAAPAAPAVPVATIPKLATATIVLTPDTTIGMPNWAAGDTPAGAQGAPIAGLNCLSSDAYHVHTHLAIIKDGQMLALPANIGILPTCTYPLHTHDATGVIHVEGPAAARFTLGQFFAIWGEPLSYSNIAGFTGLPVVVYIEDNGAVRQYTGDLADIELTEHRSITIQIGSQLTELPSYTWVQGL